jgi:hypothetical protein
MSPFSNGPQNAMGFLQPLDFTQMPFMTGPQYGQSSMDSTPGGQHTMNATPYEQTFMDLSQHALALEGMRERLTRRMTNDNNGKLIFTLSFHSHITLPSHATYNNNSTSREDHDGGERGPKAATLRELPTPLVRSAKDAKSLHPTSAERRARAEAAFAAHLSDLIPLCKSNLIILHEPQSTLPSSLRPLRQWRLLLPQ